jgi:hypothetical protein
MSMWSPGRPGGDPNTRGPGHGPTDPTRRTVDAGSTGVGPTRGDPRRGGCPGAVLGVDHPRDLRRLTSCPPG